MEVNHAGIFALAANQLAASISSTPAFAVFHTAHARSPLTISLIEIDQPFGGPRVFQAAAGQAIRMNQPSGNDRERIAGNPPIGL